MNGRVCLAEPTVIEGPMGVTRLVFEFKCNRGHRSEQRHPPGTKYDDHPYIVCPECKETINRAWLIFACPEKAGKNVGSGS